MVKRKDGKLNEGIMKAVFWLSAFMTILIISVICIFIFFNGIPTIFKIGIDDFIFGMTWRPGNELFGIFPMVVGSLLVTLLALIIGFPAGVGVSVFFAYYCPKSIYKYIKPMIDLMAGIPSIVYGFFGLMVIVPMVRNLFGGSGFSLLSSGLILGFIILPIIINISETSLRSIDESYYQGARALGANHDQSVFYVLVPAAKSGIFSSMILGMGRAIGETMALVMVAGNQALIPESLFNGIRTLTSNIVLEMGYAADLHRDSLIASAVILYVFILLINIVLVYMKGRR